MSISLIRAQNPQGVVDAGMTEQRKAADLDALIGEQVRALNKLRENWQGTAANAAIAKAYRDIQKQHLQHEKLAALAAAMQSGGHALDACRDVLLTWVEIASSMFDVSDAGVVTPRPPNDTAPWVAIAATYTKLIQQMIEAFLKADETVAKGIGAINAGWLPGNNPLPGGIDPDSLNSAQMQWLQSLAGSGHPKTGEGGVGVPNTDLSIMGMTPDGRMYTIQGDTGEGMGEDGGGPGPRPERRRPQQHHLLEDGRAREMGGRRGRQRPVPELGRRHLDNPDIDVHRRRHDVHVGDERQELGKRLLANPQFPAIQVDRRRPHLDSGGSDMAEHRPQSTVSGAELLAER